MTVGDLVELEGSIPGALLLRIVAPGPNPGTWRAAWAGRGGSAIVYDASDLIPARAAPLDVLPTPIPSATRALVVETGTVNATISMVRTRLRAAGEHARNKFPPHSPAMTATAVIVQCWAVAVLAERLCDLCADLHCGLRLGLGLQLEIACAHQILQEVVDDHFRGTLGSRPRRLTRRAASRRAELPAKLDAQLPRLCKEFERSLRGLNFQSLGPPIRLRGVEAERAVIAWAAAALSDVLALETR